MNAPTLSPKRQARREARTQAFVDAAMSIVDEQGLEGLTIKAVATHLDCAVGAIYRYFPGKGALLVAMQRRAIDDLLERCLQAFESADPGIEAILAGTRTYLGYIDVEPHKARLIDAILGQRRALLPPEDAQQVMDALAPMLEAFGRCFAQAVELGQLTAGDPARRMAILWATMQGSAQLSKLARLEGGGFLDLGDAAVRTVLSAWEP